MCDVTGRFTRGKNGRCITNRTPVGGQVGRVFQAAGVALPPNTF